MVFRCRLIPGTSELHIDPDATSSTAAPVAPQTATAASDARQTLAKEQYCGCWAHPQTAGLKAPKDMAKAELGELLLRLADQHFRSTTNSRRQRLNRLRLCSVFGEDHADGNLHYHFPISADRPWSYVPLQQALRREGIAVEFSTTHDYYWTTFMYLAVPGSNPGDKREEDLDLDPWLRRFFICFCHKSIRCLLVLRFHLALFE